MKIPSCFRLAVACMLGIFSQPATAQVIQERSSVVWNGWNPAPLESYEFEDVNTYERTAVHLRIYNNSGGMRSTPILNLDHVSGEDGAFSVSTDAAGLSTQSPFLASLPAGGSDEFYVVFAPQQVGSSVANLSISYDGGHSTQVLELRATAGGPAFIEIFDEDSGAWFGPTNLDAPDGLSHIANAPVLGSGFLRCRIVNRSPDRFFGSEVAIIHQTGEMDVFRTSSCASGSCSTKGIEDALQPGETDEFYVIYEPLDTIHSEALIQVTYLRNSKPPLTMTFEVSGNGVGDSSIHIYRTENVVQLGRFLSPTIDRSPANYAFSPPALNLNTATHDRIFLQVANSGNVPLEIISTPVSGSAFTLANSIAGHFIPAGQRSEHLELRFQPSAAGSYTGSITFNTNDPDDPQLMVNLSGEAVKPPLTGSLPMISTSFVGADGTEVRHPSDYGFAAELGSSVTKTLRIRNVGQGTLSISSFTLPAGFSSPDLPPPPIPSGTFADLSLTFTPPGAGFFDEPAMVQSNAVTNPRAIPLFGSGLEAGSPFSAVVFGKQINGPFRLIENGADAADASIENATDFREVETWNDTQLHDLSLRNLSATGMVIGRPQITGSHAEAFSVGTFRVLAPDQQSSVPFDFPGELSSFDSLSFKIVFDPTVAGTNEALVEIPYGDSTYSFTVIGEALQSPPPRITGIRGRKIICGSAGGCVLADDTSFNYITIPSGSTTITEDNATFFPPVERLESWTSNYRLFGQNGLVLTQAPEITDAGFGFVGLPDSYPALVSGLLPFQIRFSSNTEHTNEAHIPATVIFFTNDETQPVYTFDIQGRAFDGNDYPQLRLEMDTTFFGGAERDRVRLMLKGDPRIGYRPEISLDLSTWEFQPSQFPASVIYQQVPASPRVGSLDEVEFASFLFDQDLNDRAFFRLIEFED